MDQFIKVFKFSKPLKKYYAAIGVLSVFTALLHLVTPFVSRALVDEIVDTSAGKEPSLSFIVTLILVSLFSLLAISLINNLAGYFGDLMSIKLRKILSEGYYDKLMKLPQRYFDDQHTGTIIGRLDRSIVGIAEFFKQVSNLFFEILISTIFAFTIIVFYVWPVAVIMLILFPVYLYLTGLSSKEWKSFQDEILKHQDIANGRFAEVVGQVRVTKSYVREKFETNFYSKKFDSMIDTTVRQSRRWHRLDMYRRATQDVLLTSSVGFIFYEAYNGQITPGEVVLLLALLSQLISPLNFISFMVDNLQRMISGSKDYFEVMDLDEDQINSNSKLLKVKNPTIEFKNIEFGYEDDQTVLRDISFELKKGQKLALVGESGEGKSTISQLMLGLYRPRSGKILLDNQDIANCSPDSLRKNIAVVFQDSFLFSGSIAENISYGKPRATRAEIQAAAKQANAHEFIKDLKEGYNSQIGERGIKLSGGQKQRIAIARAILKDSPYLVLDEATSSLDSKSELIVQDALNNLMKDRTALIIAHRLSTIADVDKIVTLKKGEVDEIGTPKELSVSGGIYSQLLELQDVNSSKGKKLLKQFDIVS